MPDVRDMALTEPLLVGSESLHESLVTHLLDCCALWLNLFE